MGQPVLRCSQIIPKLFVNSLVVNNKEFNLEKVNIKVKQDCFFF